MAASSSAAGTSLPTTPPGSWPTPRSRRWRCGAGPGVGWRLTEHAGDCGRISLLERGDGHSGAVPAGGMLVDGNRRRSPHVDVSLIDHIGVVDPVGGDTDGPHEGTDSAGDRPLRPGASRSPG